MIFEGGKGYTVYIVITVVEFSREIHSSLRILTHACIGESNVNIWEYLQNTQDISKETINIDVRANGQTRHFNRTAGLPCV